jgi:hypothetical protein
MPIKVACQCGQQFAAKDELAGKRVKCPKCAAVLTIPQASAAAGGPRAPAARRVSELLDDAGMRSGVVRCPGCGAEMGESAVLCVMCGYDTRVGRRLKTRVGTEVIEDEEGLGDLPTHGVAALDEAERQIARDKLEQKHLSKGAPWWLILIAFIGLITFAISMVMLPQESVMDNSGLALQILGGVISFSYGLRMLIAAFKESALCGFLYILLPFYALYWIITRWDRVGGLFLMSLVGSVIYGAGLTLIALAPWVNSFGKKETKYSQLDRLSPPAIVRTLSAVELAS